MALEDFASPGSQAARPSGARRAVAPEDEDLFDFPVIEMKLAGKSAAPRPALPSNARSASPGSKTGGAAIGSPGEAGVEALEFETRAPARAASASKSVAAGLVSDLERILPDAREPVRSSSAANTAAARKPRSAPGPLSSKQIVLGLGGFLLVNAVAWFFWWKSTADFRADLEGLRNEMAFAAREIPVTVSGPPAMQATPETIVPAASTQPAPTAAAAQPQTISAQPARESNNVIPLDSFEKAALEIARIEIDSGEYSAARRRLQRLLAVVDRVEASVREDIEAQAVYLVADSYRREAQTRREVAR